MPRSVSLDEPVDPQVIALIHRLAEHFFLGGRYYIFEDSTVIWYDPLWDDWYLLDGGILTGPFTTQEEAFYAF